MIAELTDIKYQFNGGGRMARAWNARGRGLLSDDPWGKITVDYRRGLEGG